MEYDLLLWGFLVSVGVAVALFEWGMFRSVAGEEARQKRQLQERLDDLRKSTRDVIGESLLRKGQQQKSTQLYRWVSATPFVNALPLLIEQAGHRTTLARVVSFSAVFAGVVFIVAWSFTRQLPIALMMASFAAMLPTAKLQIDKMRRLAAFDLQLSDGLDIIKRALKAGHPFDAALQVVGTEMPAPIAEEFAVTSAEISYGVPVKTALMNLMVRTPSKPLRAFVTAVLVQRETGGNLAEILENISSVIRGGYRFQRKLRTLSAEGRMSAMVLGAIPIVLGGAMSVMFPDIISELFTNPRGHDLLTIAAISYIIGTLWVRRIIRIEI